MTRSRSKTVAFCGIFTVCALVFSYFESFFPMWAIIPLPGFKLGLANIVVMASFFMLGRWQALLISYTRVAIIALLFGTPVSFCFSFFGATLSFLSLLLMQIFLENRLGCIGFSVVAAAFHVSGQAIAGCIFFGSEIIFSYLPYMMILSIFSGILNAFAFHEILCRFREFNANYQQS